jgi:hypothetical protein
MYHIVAVAGSSHRPPYKPFTPPPVAPYHVSNLFSICLNIPFPFFSSSPSFLLPLILFPPCTSSLSPSVFISLLSYLINAFPSLFPLCIILRLLTFLLSFPHSFPLHHTLLPFHFSLPFATSPFHFPSLHPIFIQFLSFPCSLFFSPLHFSSLPLLLLPLSSFLFTSLLY